MMLTMSYSVITVHVQSAKTGSFKIMAPFASGKLIAVVYIAKF